MMTDQRHQPPLLLVRHHCHQIRQRQTHLIFQSNTVTSAHEAYRYQLSTKKGVLVSAENDVLGLTLIKSYTVIFTTTTVVVCSTLPPTELQCSGTVTTKNNTIHFHIIIIVYYAMRQHTEIPEIIQ